MNNIYCTIIYDLLATINQLVDDVTPSFLLGVVGASVFEVIVIGEVYAPL